MEIVKDALQKYGATLTDDGFIVKGEKVAGIKAVIKGRRLRFESADGVLYASGSITEQFVSEFVEKFWVPKAM